MTITISQNVLIPILTFLLGIFLYRDWNRSLEDGPGVTFFILIAVMWILGMAYAPLRYIFGKKK